MRKQMRDLCSSMWNDTEIPLAYLITFRCYGTWLPGDERGSIDRHHNVYKSLYHSPNAEFRKFNREQLKSEPFVLDTFARSVVELAIKEVCDFRGWPLLAFNIRTNHIHSAVSIGTMSGSQALNSFKAYATRKLREKGTWRHEHSPWASRGSKRKLWNEQNVDKAIDYVLNGQGRDLPDFD